MNPPPEDSAIISTVRDDLDIRKGELLLRERELEARLRNEGRNLWFTSPVVIGGVTAIAGLLGTGIGAALQGYWNTRLERQKFESALIQGALENADRDEVAKHLLFLVETGVIQGLNGGRIAALARTPERLPTYRAVAPTGEVVEYTVDEAGRVSFVSGWSESDIVTVTVPQLAGVAGAGENGTVRFYRAAADDLRRAFADVEQAGLLHLVRSWDGSYAPRTLRGSARASAHAFGLAFDINSRWNPAGREPPPATAEGSVVQLVPIFERHGFLWGGRFAGIAVDPNHFQWNRGATRREPR